jgi:DNA-binding response OmpR family regulator
MPEPSTILLVDDEDSVQKLLTYPLERDGFRVIAARDGEEALARFSAERVDLVVLDIMLPKLDGLEVCRLLKEERATRRIPIVMLTALDTLADVEKAVACGADDYLTKPLDTERLLDKLKRHL